jgi:hypothetical protein
VRIDQVRVGPRSSQRADRPIVVVERKDGAKEGRVSIAVSGVDRRTSIDQETNDVCPVGRSSEMKRCPAIAVWHGDIRAFGKKCAHPSIVAVRPGGVMECGPSFAVRREHRGSIAVTDAPETAPLRARSAPGARIAQRPLARSGNAGRQLRLPRLARCVLQARSSPPDGHGRRSERLHGARSVRSPQRACQSERMSSAAGLRVRLRRRLPSACMT